MLEVAQRKSLTSHKACWSLYSLKVELQLIQLIFLNIANKCWTEVKTHGIPPCARRRHSWSVLGNEAVLFGGTWYVFYH